MIAFVLAMLARQRDRGEAAIDQPRMEAADIVARRAEQHRRVGLVQAQQVDHRALDISGGDGNDLIGDVAVPAIFADGRDAQGIVLIAFGELRDRLRDRRRKKQGAVCLRSEEHTSEIQSLMRISYAVFCLKKKKNTAKT